MLLVDYEEHVRALTRLGSPSASPPAVTTVEVAGVCVDMDLSSAADFTAERRRLAKDLTAAEKTKQQVQTRLANRAFIAKAPAEVIISTQARVHEAEAQISRLTRALETLPQS